MDSPYTSFDEAQYKKTNKCNIIFKGTVLLLFAILTITISVVAIELHKKIIKTLDHTNIILLEMPNLIHQQNVTITQLENNANLIMNYVLLISNKTDLVSLLNGFSQLNFSRLQTDLDIIAKTLNNL